MATNPERARKPTDVPGSGGRFSLPPGVFFTKRRMAYGWAYVFRHRTLGELGRILLQDRPDGRCQLFCEVVGDPADPLTAARAAIFQPLALALSDDGKDSLQKFTHLGQHADNQRLSVIWPECALNPADFRLSESRLSAGLTNRLAACSKLQFLFHYSPTPIPAAMPATSYCVRSSALAW